MNKTIKKIMRSKITGVVAGGLFFVSFSSPVVYSFTSLSKQVVTMSVTIGGGDIDIGDGAFDFMPISGISPADNIVIFQGGAGTNPQGVRPDFQETLIQRVVRAKGGNSGPSYISGPDNSPIHVILHYRFVGVNDNPDTITWTEIGGPATPVSTKKAGVNASFAFQLDPNEVRNNQGKSLQYYFVGKRVNNGSFYKTFQTPTDKPYYTIELNPSRAPEILQAHEAKRIAIPQGNPNVGNTSMEVPHGVLKHQTTISISDMPLNLLPQNILSTLPSLVSVYRIDASPESDGPYKFTLSYPDFTFPIGQLGKLANTDTPEQNAIVYGWDGFTWRKLGGKVDATQNTISINSNYYSYFGVAPGFITPLDRRASRKIITPNGDGANDTTDFNLPVDVHLDIFDVSMHKVRSLTNSQNWDGRDENGKVVESGAYIYQYKAEGELVSGIIGVAK